MKNFIGCEFDECFHVTKIRENPQIQRELGQILLPQNRGKKHIFERGLCCAMDSLAEPVKVSTPQYPHRVVDFQAVAAKEFNCAGRPKVSNYLGEPAPIEADSSFYEFLSLSAFQRNVRQAKNCQCISALGSKTAEHSRQNNLLRGRCVMGLCF
ncbi:hypothetical protein Y030_2141 [Burkholderia pseudomallei MSHR332]|nr:hypothetical protein Y030_2141 [Burkholderia pseudomallei MSHR332]